MSQLTVDLVITFGILRMLIGLKSKYFGLVNVAYRNY